MQAPAIQTRRKGSLNLSLTFLQTDITVAHHMVQPALGTLAVVKKEVPKLGCAAVLVPPAQPTFAACWVTEALSADQHQCPTPHSCRWLGSKDRNKHSMQRRAAARP